ncbi:MAG: AMP-binding protein [Pseudomonadota bacterium]
MDTLVDLVEGAAAAYGDRPALTIRRGLRQDTWSYRRLAAASAAVAAHLADDRGLDAGARVLVWGPNSPQLVAACSGVLRARLVLVPVDPYATPAALARIADHTSAALLISGQGTPCEIETVELGALPLDGRGYAGPRPHAEETAELVYTSGATGRPKGVLLTHANVVANVRSADAALRPTRDFRLLSVLPLSHMFEQTAGLFLPLHAGASVHYPASRQPPVLLATMRRHRVTAMVVVPQVLELLLDAVEREVRRRGSLGPWETAHRLAPHLPQAARRILFRRVHDELGGSLELFVCGGAALAPEIAAAWERLGVTVLEGYGATECAPSIASNTRAARRSGTVGRPIPGVDVRLGGEGEILVRGDNVTHGYWGDVEATRAAFTEDGWYRTGDLGELDADGYLRLRGRLTEVIVLPSGLNVHPEDVEEELLREEAVADCAVVARPGAAGRASVHAVVVPSSTGTGADDRVADAVRAANRRLAPHQRVAGFTVWSDRELPRTTLRKVQRHEVAAALAGGPAAGPAPGPREGAADRRSRALRLLAELAPTGSSIDAASDLTLDLGLDSLGLVELAVRLERELGLSVEDGDLATATTVGELVALAEAGEAVSPPVAFPWWALRRPARVLRAGLQAALLFPAHAVVCKPFRVEGRAELAAVEPPVLLVANHASHLDTPSILRALPRRLRARVAVAAAADYFFRARVLRVLTPLLLNGFPFSREGAVRSSLDHCGDLADRGWSILVYPEGTRSPAGRLQPFRSGSGLLAVELGMPVVPVAVAGTHALWPKGRRLPRRGPVVVRFGQPVRVGSSDAHADVAAQLARAVATLLAP